MPELIGRLQRILVDFVMGRGECLSGTVLDPFYPSNLGNSPTDADKGHLRPWENASLSHAALSIVPVQPRLKCWRDSCEPLGPRLVNGCGDAELAVIGEG